MFIASRWNILLFFIGFIKADYGMQQAIKAFVEFHSKGCQILLFTYSNEFYERKLLIDFYKATITNNFIPTVLENINNDYKINSSISAKRQCSRPVRSFIMGNVSYIAEYVISEERREDIRKDAWLLFVANDFEQELIISQIKLSMRSEVYVARKTNNGYEFWEIYRPAKNNPIRVIHYGNWNADTGLKAIELPVLERRRDFGGVVLRAATLKKEKYSSIEDRKHVELLNVVSRLLEKELNFSLEFVVVPDNSSEYVLDEDPYNIIIHMLERNEVDISLVGHSLQSENQNIVDYSGPVVQTHFRVYLKNTNTKSGWFNFLNPLPVLAWYIVIFTALVSPVIILFMYYIGRKAGLIKTQSNFLDLCFTVHQMICLQGGALQEDLYSVNLVFVFFNLWAFLIRSIYSASLASSLAIEQYAVPFYSLEGLLENGQYEFGVYRYSSAFDLYYKTDDSFLKKLNKAVMEQNISNLPTTYLEGLKRVCSENKYAFMASKRKVLELESELSCKLNSLPFGIYTISTAYAMSKHNEYLPFINRWLLVLEQTGLLAKLKHDVMENVPSNFDEPQSFKSLDFHDTMFLHILVIGGMVSSVLILFAEILHSKMRRCRREEYR